MAVPGCAAEAVAGARHGQAAGWHCSVVGSSDMRGSGGAGVWAVSVPALGAEDDLSSPMEGQWRHCCSHLVHIPVPCCNACNTLPLPPLSASANCVQHTCMFWDGVLASCATEGCVMGECLKSRDGGK